MPESYLLLADDEYFMVRADSRFQAVGFVRALRPSAVVVSGTDGHRPTGDITWVQVSEIKIPASPNWS